MMRWNSVSSTDFASSVRLGVHEGLCIMALFVNSVWLTLA